MIKRKFKFRGIFILFLISVLILSNNDLLAQKKNKEKEDSKEKKDEFSSETLSGLKFRNIGPAYASGRIADFAVNPNNHSEWYVAVASGNIWKTTNNGQTFSPIFDKYGAYSIGCLKLDPNNTNVIWAGTGENNHQRALGYGDGVYKSVDGGKSWTNMGLKNSRQIGMIAIDKRNSNIVFVAAEGSVWGAGGDRGLYKTIDGGKTWKKVLEISENTGVNNVVIDLDNQDIMYATSEQRRRHVHTKIGGGPESAIYKSTDGGENWRKLSSGLPSGHVGGIGIDVSPVNSNIVYAIIEAEGETGGFFRSTDKGESWEKMSKHSSSGQYYNEIYCDPVDVNKVYSVETFTHFTVDGGKTWKKISDDERHVDDHALWIDPEDTKHFLIGGDGGIYESYDEGNNFRQISNLPVTQFYRVYLDNDLPFYNVYGGTQDNNSIGGPSRNISKNGVSSGEWINTIGGDGFWGAVDSEDPNIVYSEYQYGNLYRFDKKSGERLFIKPQAGKDELTYKWNWNTPFIISQFSNKRLYIAANKVFRSDDRGNSWKVISDDITANIDRNSWPVMGKYWSSDAVVKDVSTSLYGMAVSMAESPVKENLLYVGTDDGLIQITEDVGQIWYKAGFFPGVPANTYVSDVFPSRFDENIVFASFDNMKRDDFKPYLLKSKDKGKTWASIANDLPVNGTVHTIEQDFKNPDLLFVGTEFGFYYSYNGGTNWIQMKSGLPTIAVKDIAIQKRESDIVLATFGRGFYILDDYSPLRSINPNIKNVKAKIFPIKDALVYIQSGKKYGQGATYFLAKNPEFGATFTYYLNEEPKSDKQKRKEIEKKLFKEGKKIKQLTWKEERDENKEDEAYLLFKITDENGNIVRKLTAKPSSGINRITWDLRYEDPYPIKLKDDKFNPFEESSSGLLAMPGKYKVSITLFEKGQFNEIVAPMDFKVNGLNNKTLSVNNINDLISFQKDVSEITKQIIGKKKFTDELNKKIISIKQTVLNSSKTDNDLMLEVLKIEKELDDIIFEFEGYEAKASYEEIPPHKPALLDRLDYVMYTHYNSTSDITETEKEQLKIVKEQFELIKVKIDQVNKQIKNIEDKLNKVGAQWTPGRF
ncbi:MAG: hypothetical protein JXR51_16675 [Bacteroidales bacterium]|nr:hypothetical protein [Bacteroidales bacterium]MBN2758803.1 hypothetical protein [Bacteroidales bacterium]